MVKVITIADCAPSKIARLVEIRNCLHKELCLCEGMVCENVSMVLIDIYLQVFFCQFFLLINFFLNKAWLILSG